MASMAATSDDELDATFAALANSTRRAILSRLAQGEASVNELAEPFSMSLPAISKHLKVLESVGLITRGRDRQFRPCALDPTALEPALGWAESTRATWHARLDRLESHLNERHEP